MAGRDLYVPEISHEAIIAIYDALLPKYSKGRSADNPERFPWFWLPIGSDPGEWPNLALARDHNGVLTWHTLCGYNIERTTAVDYFAETVEKGREELLHDAISRLRPKRAPLKAFELIERGRGHVRYNTEFGVWETLREGDPDLPILNEIGYPHVVQSPQV